MNNNFFIYFDLSKKQEIIKYRKLFNCFVVDTDDSEILNYYNIDENDNPHHIINEKDFKNSTYSNFISKKLFIDYDADYEIKTQPIGTLLLEFINMDLSDCENLKAFIYKYGLDLLVYLDRNNILPIYNEYLMDDFDSKFNTLFDTVKKSLLKIQMEFKNVIDFCYFNTNNSLSLLTSMQKYFLSYHSCTEDAFFTYKPVLEKYSKGISINFESFFNTDIYLTKYSSKSLIRKVCDKGFAFSPYSYSYVCNKLENVLFLSFTNIINIEKLEIKICENCKKYFIPISKSNEKFCTNYISKYSKKTCRDVGAFNSYNNKIKDNEIESLIRKTSSYLAMQVKRNPDIDLYNLKYENWKKEYKLKKIDYKDNKITKDELIEWIKMQRR